MWRGACQFRIVQFGPHRPKGPLALCGEGEDDRWVNRPSPRVLVLGALVASLMALPFGGPSAAAAEPFPVAPCGSLGPPVCDLLQVVQAALAPLEPVLAMGGALTDSLGATIHGLQATVEQAIGDPEAVNAQDLAEQVGDLLDQLSVASTRESTSLARPTR